MINQKTDNCGTGQSSRQSDDFRLSHECLDSLWLRGRPAPGLPSGRTARPSIWPVAIGGCVSRRPPSPLTHWSDHHTRTPRPHRQHAFGDPEACRLTHTRALAVSDSVSWTCIAPGPTVLGRSGPTSRAGGESTSRGGSRSGQPAALGVPVASTGQSVQATSQGHRHRSRTASTDAGGWGPGTGRKFLAGLTLAGLALRPARAKQRRVRVSDGRCTTPGSPGP